MPSKINKIKKLVNNKAEKIREDLTNRQIEETFKKEVKEEIDMLGKHIEQNIPSNHKKKNK